MGCGSSNAAAALPQQAPADLTSSAQPTAMNDPEPVPTRSISTGTAREAIVAAKVQEDMPPSPASKLFNSVPTNDAASAVEDTKEEPPQETAPAEPVEKMSYQRSMSVAGAKTPSDIAAIVDSAPTAYFENIFGFGKSIDEAKPGSNKFVIYFMIRVRLETSSGLIRHITVYRRFSQFELLREKLLRDKQHHGGNIPTMPKKKFFGAQRNIDFLNRRQSDLNQWMRAVSLLPSVSNSEYCNLFLMEEADDAPPDFTVLKTIDAIGLSRVTSNVSETFSDDESEVEFSDLGSDTVSSLDNSRTNGYKKSSSTAADVVSALPPAPPPSSTLARNTEQNGATIMPNKVRSPSIRAAFELGAKRTPKIYFDGIACFGHGLDADSRLRKKMTLYYVLKIRYTDEQKCLELNIDVYRRYSQFENLRENLVNSHLHGDVPPLPKKKMFGRTNRSSDHAMQRMADLNDWLRKVSALPHICSDEYYKDFVTNGANKPPEEYTADEEAFKSK